MSTSSPTATMKRPSAPRLAALPVIVTLGMLLVSARPSIAQSPTERVGNWELRVTSGGLVPTGAQRKAVKDAQLSALQLSWLVRPSLALTGTFGWARSRDLLTSDDAKLDVFTYDLGAEARASEWFADRAVTLRPFIGAGAGARSYNYRDLDVDATHNLAGYASIGSELGVRRVALRLEVRDYIAGFKPLAGRGASETRNDVLIMVGVRFRKDAEQIAP